MALPSFTSPSPEFPPDLVEAIEADATADAEHVACFLDTLTGHQPTDPPLPLPAGFLLDLAAALRLLLWELSGLRSHIDADLPLPREALRQAFQWLTEPGVPGANPSSGALMPRLLDLFIRRCAWHGRRELDADLVLGDVAEDAFADALADFVWNHRHDVRLNPSTERGTP